MEKITDTTEYETPQIEDHGDLTELTASGTVGTLFDGEFTAHKGQSSSGHLEPSAP
jgi:hypothetical protein